MDPPRAAQPSIAVCDVFNSSNTGHQVADRSMGNTTWWRDSRNVKLNNQFRGTRENEKQDRQKAIFECLAQDEQRAAKRVKTDDHQPKTAEAPITTECQVFSNLVFYVNGSTAPVVSDFMIKQIISKHGGRVCVFLGRRQVTHVIIGKSAGGGLSGRKVQMEIDKRRGKQVHFVTAEWVMDSAKAGKRLPESRYQAVRLASCRTNRISDAFKPTKASATIGPTSHEEKITGSQAGASG
ncbi:hypothetical protein K470DRAFT_17634 [Piedraia hortae CBS 480.64]|uniref:BRCT domain-containing protein n=1 Tax=Piedraia hortae CBS 480.64 TaxID=1314780 RepID=A0A6A7C5A1_9PEZI|nr:hypothetical protein K470DRAFT_17634 [Piedraia hortae CBS 480.64]